MRNVNFPFNSRPYSGEMAQGGLASIPRYAEGAEEEIEEKEESTLEQIIGYLLQHSGILPEGMSLEGLLGGEGMAGLLGEEEMAHGGVVPGTNPIQGQKDGPTVGFVTGGGMPTNVLMNAQRMQTYMGMGPSEYRRKYGHSINLNDDMAVTMAIMDQRAKPQVQAETAPAPTPDPDLPQSFGDLQTAKGVQDPIGAYVVGSPSREQLLAQYFPATNPAIQQQQATALPQLTEDQLLGLAGLV